jgi:hypothetical protein
VCRANADCAPSKICVDGTCQPRAPFGAACTASAECASGICACVRGDCVGDGVCADAYGDNCPGSSAIRTPEGHVGVCAADGALFDCTTTACPVGQACHYVSAGYGCFILIDRTP